MRSHGCGDKHRGARHKSRGKSWGIRDADLTAIAKGEVFGFLGSTNDSTTRRYSITPKLHDVTPVQETLLLTLYGGALDSRASHSIVGDKMADEIAGKIGYDFAKLKLGSNIVCPIALRAKMLDGIVRQFVADHPDAVVLDLRAGLDDRIFRVAPPPTVDWYRASSFLLLIAYVEQQAQNRTVAVTS
jgi:hypothetical protein